jgi:hypothetical protein
LLQGFHIPIPSKLNFMKRQLLFAASIVWLSMFLSCEKDAGSGTKGDDEAIDSVAHESADDYTWNDSDIVYIDLKGTSVSITGSGATAEGSKVTIASAGVYSISGPLSNGQIVVNTADEGTVKLIFNGINVHCHTSAPVYVKKAEKVVINLAENTDNYLTDSTTYTYDDAENEEPNAALFSKSDLTLFGTGNLTVKGKFNDGISSKDGLILKSGTLNVSAADDGIRGKDYLIVKDGNITVNSTGDGLKSDNDADAYFGYVSVESGAIKVVSGGDAISAESRVVVSGGAFNLSSGGGSSKSKSSTVSQKGIKGLVSVSINCDTLAINSADDGLHSNGSVTVSGGSVSISSGDDGVHGNTSVLFEDCTLSITKAYEGVESALITVDNSIVAIIASDDGFNATHGVACESDDKSCLKILSGYVYVSTATGDGLDSNGSIIISGGTVIVHGPASEPEVGMDYNGTCSITGGTVVISGISSNMTQAPGTSSTQYAVLIRLSSSKSAKTLINIQDANKKSILTFAPARSYQSIIFSSSELAKGTYTINTGGSCTGTVTNGLYTGGSYSGGTSYTSFTISSMITTVGSSSNRP